MVKGSTPIIIDNKLKFALFAFCSAVFMIGIANFLPDALAIPDVFDSPPYSVVVETRYMAERETIIYTVVQTQMF